MALYSSNESSLRDYLKIIFRYKAIIVVIVVVTMATIFIRRELVTPLYTASVKMLIYGTSTTEDAHYKQIMHPRGLLSIHSEMLKSRRVMERVVKSLKLYERPIDEELQYASKLKAVLISQNMKDQQFALEEMGTEQRNAFLFDRSLERLKGSVGISYDQEALNFIYMIHVKDFNPAAAVTIANVVAKSLVIGNIEEEIAERKLRYGDRHSSIVQLENYIDEMSETLDGRLVSDIEAWGPASLKILEQAQTSFPKAKMTNARISIIFFVSLLFGCFIAYILDLMDETFKTPHDIEKFLNIPFLGSIPDRKSTDKVLISDLNQDTHYTKAYQGLSEQLYLLMKNKNLNSLLIVDMSHSGKSSFQIANLGIYLTQRAGHNVLIIDADLRSPSLHSTFKVTNTPGLNDVLDGKVPFEGAVQALDPNLYLMPAEKAVMNPIALLDSPAMSELIKKAKEKFDVTFINCADMKNSADAVSLSAFSEGVAIIINEGKDRRHIVENAVNLLKERNANIVGAILNNRKYVIPQIIYKLT